MSTTNHGGQVKPYRAGIPSAYTHNAGTKGELRAGNEISREEVGALLAEIIDRDYESLRACARKWKVSAAYLADVNSFRRDPGPAILNKLGLTKVVTVSYRAAR